MCKDEAEAKLYLQILEHPLYVFINNICRWGNFNNIRILQQFPKPDIEYTGKKEEIYDYFKITEKEVNYILANI
jgi:hypothetical protein